MEFLLVGTEREHNDFVLQQWKHQRCNCSVWQQIMGGLLQGWEEAPFPRDGYIPSEKGGLECTHHWVSWGHKELRVCEWEAPCACAASHGQNQAVGTAGCMMATLCHPATVTAWCQPSAGIHAPVHLCLKGWNIDPSAEWDGDYWWKTFSQRWLQLWGASEGKGCAVSS